MNKDYRLLENRSEGFDLFYKFHLQTNDWSPDISCTKWVADQLGFDYERRCTMAFFYGALYASPYEMLFSELFPTLTYDNIPQLTEFYQDNKKRLLFASDAKYRKMVFEKFLESVRESLKLSGTLGKFILGSCAVPGDPISDYRALQRECFDKWFHWGRMGHWCFSEAYNYYSDHPITPPTMEFATGKSHRSGWAFCVGRDDLVGEKVSASDIEYLERSAAEYLKTVKHPMANMYTLETACCNYKRQHKGSRYGGCYIDEQYDDLMMFRNNWPEYSWIADKYLEARQHIIPKAMRYEDNVHATEHAYMKDWKYGLRDHGRMLRAEAWHNGESQRWDSLDNVIGSKTTLNSFLV